MPCNRPGPLASPLGVDAVINGRNILSLTSSSPFSSLATLTYDEIVYVLAGTLGQIEQV